VRAEVCDYSLVSGQKAARVGEPWGLSKGYPSQRLKHSTTGEFVHPSGKTAPVCDKHPCFPQAMLPWKGCRVPLCPTPTSAFTSGQKMTSSVSAPGGLWQVWTLPEAGKLVQNMSFSPDSWAVSFIISAQGPSSWRLMLTAPAFLQWGVEVRSQNHRMLWVGRDLCGSASPTPCPSRVTQSRLHSTASRPVLNISREGDSTTFLGNLGLAGQWGEGDERGPLWGKLQQDVSQVPDLSDAEISSWCNVKWE